MKPLFLAGQVATMLGAYRTYIAQRTNKPGGIRGTRVSRSYVYTQEDIDEFKKIYKPRRKVLQVDPNEKNV